MVRIYFLCHPRINMPGQGRQPFLSQLHMARVRAVQFP